MASAEQIDLFNRLTADKDFGNAKVDDLKAQFATLNTKSASAWIEKALSLDDKEFTPPAF